jgi:hypothetical protein
MKKKLKKKSNKKTEATQVNSINSWSRIWDQDNLTEKKAKKNHKAQGSITYCQRIKLKKKINSKKVFLKKLESTQINNTNMWVEI